MTWRPSTTRVTAAAVAAVVPLTVLSVWSAVASASTALPPLPAGFVSTPAPADGVFTVTGRSWGHRIGMSQVGAQYAGRAGVSAAAILAHYYPGTSLVTITAAQRATTWPGTPVSAPRPVLRVKLEANNVAALTVTAAPGLQLRSSDGRLLPLPSSTAATRWRLVPVATAWPIDGLRTQYTRSATSTGWVTVGSVLPIGSGFASTSAVGVRVELASGQTRVEPTAVVLTTDRPGTRTWATVSLVDPDVYLDAVVPAEIGSSSAPTTLQAQAVAARTYAARLAYAYGRTYTWDVCSTTRCQYYPGMSTGTVALGVGRDVRRLYPSATAAVAATADRILTYRGTPALTMFAAANGGYSRSGGLPYLPARPDPWDAASGSVSHAWSGTLPVSVVTRLVPAGDRLTAIAVGGRDGLGDLGGTPSVVLLDSVSATGQAHRTTTTPSDLRWAWPWPGSVGGLRSTWFAITGPSAPPAPTHAPPVTPPPTPAPTTASGATPTTVANPVLLRRGDSGSAVVAVQRLLRVTPVGYYGPLTTAAVARWQRNHHLHATGAVDLITWRALGLATSLMPRA
jgi:peptidoglycan hydrolase-like amidase